MLHQSSFSISQELRVETERLVRVIAELERSDVVSADTRLLASQVLAFHASSRKQDLPPVPVPSAVEPADRNG